MADFKIGIEFRYEIKKKKKNGSQNFFQFSLSSQNINCGIRCTARSAVRLQPKASTSAKNPPIKILPKIQNSRKKVGWWWHQIKIRFGLCIHLIFYNDMLSFLAWDSLILLINIITSVKMYFGWIDLQTIFSPNGAQ